MLTSIRQRDGKQVLARDVSKDDKPFMCPECHNETILRKGQVRIHHFAHKPPIPCEYGKGESEEHRRCKLAIFDALQPFNRVKVELEKSLGRVVPDLLLTFQKDQRRIAIEVQLSTLTMDKIISRTERYNELGIHVLWLPVYNPKLEEEKYSPKLWEKWLHATYYGRVYYWLEELKVQPIHFDDYKLYVETSHWYTSEGEERFEGGYDKKSKRYRTPNHGSTLDISVDFTFKSRDYWQGGDIKVPESKIVLDRHGAWWK